MGFLLVPPYKMVLTIVGKAAITNYGSLGRMKIIVPAAFGASPGERMGEEGQEWQWYGVVSWQKTAPLHTQQSVVSSS